MEFFNVKMERWNFDFTVMKNSQKIAEFLDIFKQDDIKDKWISIIEFENSELYK